MNEKILNELKTAVDEQIETANPPETKTVYEKLLDKGHSIDEAKNMIADVIYKEALAIVASQEPFNRDRYVTNLKLLIAEED